MSKYAAFLRGINVGGNKKVEMTELKKTFDKMDFKNAKTFLASGNVVFESTKASNETLEKKISENLEKKFGFEIGVIVRSIDELQKLHDSQPFKKIKITPETRLYVTFLPSNPKIKSIESPDENYKILKVTGSEIISVLVLSEGSKTIELMSILDKQFGKKITTRNWNTIEKMLK